MTKLEALKAGKYRFKCPSVTTILWDDADWITYIDICGLWTVEVTD